MFYRNNNKSNSLVDMTIEDYNLVITEKDIIIENISSELDDLKEKHNKIKTGLKLFLNKYNFNEFNEISNFLDKYFDFLKKFNFNNFDDIVLFVNKFKERENVNIPINNTKKEEYECKNECCCDYVYIPNTYCEDCQKEIKQCKKCKKEFWNDEIDVNKCENCILYENDGYYSDEEDNDSVDFKDSEADTDSSISDYKNNNESDEGDNESKEEINSDDEKNKLDIVNNLKNDVVDEKLPRKDKKINVNDIFIEIKENKDGNININYNNEIFNNIKNISEKRIEKYKLMIELYEKLKILEIDKPIKFKKYLEENNTDDLFFIPIESKSRRIFDKCKKLYIINNYIKIESLLCLKKIDKIFTLKNKEFDELIYLFKQNI